MVDLFFMLSGFGMMIGYGKRVFEKNISFKCYFIKRLKRLYPLFIFTTALVFFLELIYRHKIGETFIYPNYDIYHVVQNMLFLQYGVLGQEFSLNGPSWCIPICLACYCLFYFIVYQVKKYRHIFYAFSFTAILGAALIASGLAYPIFNNAMGRGIASFSTGVLLAFAYEERKTFKSLKLGYCCLIFLVTSYFVLRFKSINLSGNFLLLMTLGFGPMIIISTLFIPWQNALMKNPLLKYLGAISWGIYLFHFPVQCIIKIIDVYWGLALNYSSEFVWILYVLVTLCTVLTYNLLLSKKIDSFVWNFFKLEDESV